MKRFTLLFLVSAISGFAQIPAYIPTSSLVAWYPFSGNAMDMSGNNNHCASFGGAALDNDRNGNALSSYYFDGVNDYLNSTVNFFNSSEPHTIAFWWKTADYSKTSQTFYSASPFFQEGAIFNHTLNGTPQKITYFLGTGAGSWDINNSAAGFTMVPNFTIWHHLIIIRNSTEWKFYNNGVLTHTFASAATGTATANLRFGAENNGAATKFYKGNLDDIGIWNRVLTDCEIAQLYAAAVATVAIASSNTGTMCTGETVTLTASGASSYTWNPSGSNNSTIAVSPSVTSSYSVAGYSSVSTCSSNTVYTQQVSLCTGIEVSALEDGHIRIGPNPNSGQFTVFGNREIRITLTDLYGREIREIQLKKENEFRSEIKGLEKGIYFLNEEKKTGVTKVIVN